MMASASSCGSHARVPLENRTSNAPSGGEGGRSKELILSRRNDERPKYNVWRLPCASFTVILLTEPSVRGSSVCGLRGNATAELLRTSLPLAEVFTKYPRWGRRESGAGTYEPWYGK